MRRRLGHKLLLNLYFLVLVKNNPASASRSPDDPIPARKASPVTRIQPPQKKVSLRLRELLDYWDLIFILIWREIKIRYKQTVVGSAWAIIQPVVSMLIFTLLFDKVMNVPSGNIPYPIFSFCALVPWTYFTHALTKTSRCLVDNRVLLVKVYFPRLIYPLAAALGGLIDFFIALAILVIMQCYYGIAPSAAVLLFPFFLSLNILAALSVGLWLAAINVQYRDVMNVLPFLMQIWLFITPVAYSSGMIPEKWQFVYGLNPMTGVVEGFRWIMLGSSAPPPAILLASIGMIAILLISGLFFYKKREDYFTDVI